MAVQKRTASDELVELGDEVETTARRKGSPVVAIRVAPELLERVVAYAQENGVSTSDVFRAGAERLVLGTPAAPFFVSGTLLVTSGGQIVQASPSRGVGRSERRVAQNALFAGTVSE